MSDVTKSEYPDYAYIIFDDICDIIVLVNSGQRKFSNYFGHEMLIIGIDSYYVHS